MKEFQNSNVGLNFSMRRDAELDEEELQESLWLASKGQKMVLYSILLNLLLGAVEKSNVLPSMLIWGLIACVFVYLLLGVARMCTGLDMVQGQRILFLVLLFSPLINVMIIVYLSVKTTGALREGGWKVGLLGG